MEQNKRDTGIDLIGGVPWGTHFCQLYQTKEDLLDILIPYFKAGLAANEYCMWVTAEPLTKPEAEEAARTAIPDFDRYLAKGQIEILPYTEWYLKGGTFDLDRVLNGWIDKLERALHQGYAGLRVTGNTAWLEKSDWQDFAEYEAAIEGVIGQYKMIAICSYWLDRCGASEIMDVIKNHEFALISREGKWELIETLDHRRMREALQQTENKYSSLFQNMLNAFGYHQIVTDETGRPVDYVFLEVNEAFEKFTGLRKEEILGKKVTEVIPGIQQEAFDWIGTYGRVAQTGEGLTFDQYSAPLGRWYTVSAYSPARGYFVTLFTDITERKRAEEDLRRARDELEERVNTRTAELARANEELRAEIVERRQTEASLQQSEERFRVSIENMLDSFGIYSAVRDHAGHIVDFRVEYVNASACVSNQLTKEQQIGQTLLALLPSHRESGLFDDYCRVVETGQPLLKESLVYEDVFGGSRLARAFDIRAVKLGDGFAAAWRDITERKHAEDVRARLAAIVEFSDDAIIGQALDGTVVTWNRAAERRYGFAAEEVLGKPLSMIIPPDRAGELPEILNQVRRGEAVENYETVRVDKRGLRIDVSVTVSPIKDAAGRVIGASTIGRDITGRKRAEHALQQASEELERRVQERTADLAKANEELREIRDYLENLLNYANAPIIVWDQDFRITQFNHAFEHLTGYPASEMIGQELKVLFPEATRDESLAQIARTSTGAYWESVEIPILRKDEDVRIALWNSANIYSADGKTLLATIAQGQDISERKRAEEALRETRNYLENLLNYANAPIIVWDPSFRITQFNHAFEHLTGYTAEEVIGRELRLLFPEVSREESLAQITRTLSGEYWESVEIPILRKDGDVRIALWNSANIYAADGKTLLVTIAQGQDITERKQAEEEVKKLNQDLEWRAVELTAMNKELEAFSYSVSHDLRAPLRGIDGFSQAVLEDYSDKLDEQGKDYLRRVRVASQRMAQLIDDVLDLSRVTRSEMRIQKVDLSALAREVAGELRDAQPDRDVEFVIAPGLEASGDARLLQIVLANLLGNAWKFTSKHSRARIEFGVTDQDGEQAYFVRDDGAGFDMAYAGKLFGTFQRLHGATEFSGTGIGLATVQRIVHRHGGRVWAESAVEQGATFYFTL